MCISASGRLERPGHPCRRAQQTIQRVLVKRGRRHGGTRHRAGKPTNRRRTANTPQPANKVSTLSPSTSVKPCRKVSSAAVASAPSAAAVGEMSMYGIASGAIRPFDKVIERVPSIHY